MRKKRVFTKSEKIMVEGIAEIARLFIVFVRLVGSKSYFKINEM